MSKNVFKNEEELNKALDEIYDAYSKPPTKTDYLYVGIWLALLPLIGIIGYLCNVSWLLYIIGGIVTLTQIFFLFTGALWCLGSIILIISCVIMCSITKSFWTGLILGSCISEFILSIMMCFQGKTAITNLFKK